MQSLFLPMTLVFVLLTMTSAQLQPDGYLDPLPPPLSISLNLQFSYTVDISNCSRILEIITNAQFHLHVRIDWDNATEAEIEAQASVVLQKPSISLTILNNILDQLKGDLVSAVQEIKKIENETKAVLEGFRDRLVEAKDQLESFVQIVQQTEGYSAKVAVIQTQIAVIHRQIDDLIAQKFDLQFGISAIHQNIEAIKHEAIVVYIAGSGILPLDQTKLDQLKQDAIVLLKARYFLNRLLNHTQDRIQNLTQHIYDLQQRIQEAVTERVQRVDEIKQQLHDDFNNVVDHLVEDVKTIHPAVVDAKVSVTVGDHNVTVDVEVGVNTGLPIPPPSHEVIALYLRATVALSLGTLPDNVQEVPQSGKRSFSLSFKFVVSDGPTSDLSVELHGSVSFTAGEAPPTVPTDADMANIRVKVKMGWVSFILQRLSEVGSWGDLDRLKDTFLLELRGHKDNETDGENDMNNCTKSLNDALDHYRSRFEDFKHNVLQGSNTDGPKAILKNREEKLNNSLFQLRAYLAQQRFFVQRATYNFVQVQFYLLQQLINASVYLNMTGNVKVDILNLISNPNASLIINLNATFQMVADAYLRKLVAENLAEKAQSFVEERERQLQTYIGDVGLRIKELDLQGGGQSGGAVYKPPTVEEVRTRIRNDIDAIKQWVKSDVEDCLNGTNVSSIVEDLVKGTDQIGFTLRITTQDGTEDIKKAVLFVVVATAGVPPTSVTVTVGVSNSLKRQTSPNSVSAVITLSSGTTPTPTPSSGNFSYNAHSVWLLEVVTLVAALLAAFLL